MPARRGNRRSRPLRRFATFTARAALAAGGLVHGGAALAQDSDGIDAQSDTAINDFGGTVIIVSGQRGSAIADVAPVTVLNADALNAIGANSIDDINQAILGQTQSADGSPPIFLLNAQRVSGYEEIGSLPPEAIETVEVLPEQAALRFGFPPTRRVVNFITKTRFDQVDLYAAMGSTIPFGSATETARTGYTRLRSGARMTANLEYAHTDPLLNSERNLGPDPDVPFDATGNVTGISGGEIDPALSGLAGRPVVIAPVPGPDGDTGSLADYAAAAGVPRLYDVGSLGSLAPGKDTIKGEAVLADLIGDTLAGSLTASVEHGRERTYYGPATARLIVPAENPVSPFATDVLLNRYLVEAEPLGERKRTTTIAAGASLRGAIAGWQWDATLALKETAIHARSGRGIDITRANAAIAAGADPFAPLDAALLTDRQIDRTRQRTRSVESKAVMSGNPFDLPAGSATATATLDVARLGTTSSLEGEDPFSLELGRTRYEGGLALDLPIASRSADVLQPLGDLSLNAAAKLRHVDGFGTLRDRTLGIAWSPVEGVQLNGTVQHDEAAPDLTQQSTPPRRIEDVPFFDFASGRSEIVTLFTGGNPDLLAQGRTVRTASVVIQPIRDSQLRLNLSYTDTDTRNQTGTIFANSPETEALVPDLFTRDASGALTAVTFRPINFFAERERKLQLSLTSSGKIGAPPAAPAEGTAPLPDDRATYYLGLVPIFALTDDLQLRAETRTLDLLNGDSVGSYKPPFSGYGYAGVNKDGYGVNGSFYYGGPRRIRSDVPSSDLTFASIFQLNLTGYLPVQALVPRATGADKLQLRIEGKNLLDARQQVTDGNGQTPYRYLADVIDPIGRTVTVSLRKRF
ncbi:hypothetical protein ACXYN8_01985 [Altererythrobacter sp. CAU 1778]